MRNWRQCDENGRVFATGDHEDADRIMMFKCTCLAACCGLAAAALWVVWTAPPPPAPPVVQRPIGPAPIGPAPTDLALAQHIKLRRVNTDEGERWIATRIDTGEIVCVEHDNALVCGSEVIDPAGGLIRAVRWLEATQ